MARQLVVVDASVVLKWFHAAGEEAVEPARTILDAFARRQVDLVVLDLTIYEIGNVLVRAGAGPQSTATVLGALTEICQAVTLSGPEHTPTPCSVAAFRRRRLPGGLRGSP